MKKTLIIDGLNLFKIGYHGVKDFYHNGKHIGGIWHFLNTIRRFIEEHNYDKVLVFWDGNENSLARKTIYPQYKYRSEPENPIEEESFKEQKERVKQYLEEMFIRQINVDKNEADDLIAFYCQIAENENITIFSGDRDLTQLISKNVSIYSPNTKKTYKYGDKVKLKEIEVPHQNVKLCKILIGDKSDNIDGIAGCGLKTIIKRFPEVVEEKEITIDDMFILCENRKSENKFYDKILDGKKIIERNYKLMQLSDPEIPTNKKLTINQKYLDNSAKLDKLGFIKKAMGMKVINSFGDVNSWIQTTFAKLHK